MIKYLILLSLFSTSLLASDPLKVAIVDTGLDLQDERFKGVLCPYGHKDFTGTGIQDDLSHGTHVAGVIKQYAKNANYCLIILKYYALSSQDNTISNEVEAFQEAVSQGASIVNFSAGGSVSVDDERTVIFSHPDVLFVAAAGNNGEDIDNPKTPFYPASYLASNVLPIGNIKNNGERDEQSNYGSRVIWEKGNEISSTCPNGKVCTLSGTSMAAAVHTGKMVYERAKNSNL